MAIHIVPQLPPANSGVGDYATLVGRRMEKIDDGVVCGYVATGQMANNLPPDGLRIRNFTGRCEPHTLWKAVRELVLNAGLSAQDSNLTPTHPFISVVLHYSGYGYDRNGCPRWLVLALRQRPEWVTRIVTYFHELYATGPPWRRAFWHSRRQQQITADAARLSDVVLTNREQSARWLEGVTGRTTGSVISLPVPSNMGEPAVVPAFNTRPPIAVCFGAAKFKECFLGRLAISTSAVCVAAGIREIVSIGQNATVRVGCFERHGINVKQLGPLPAEGVSAWLGKARLGFIAYFPGYLAKSGSIAALASHGVAMVMSDACIFPEDGLTPGRHFLRLSDAGRLGEDSKILSAELSDAADQSHNWYKAHNCEAHARTMLDGISDCPARSEKRAATCY